MCGRGEPTLAGQSPGRYANYFSIGHNAFEFVFDFGQAYEAQPPQSAEQVDIHTRLIASPPSARVFLQVK